MYFVYVLSCADKTYHYGVTRNLENRLAYHQNGENPNAYTFDRRPVKLCFEKAFKDVRKANLFIEQFAAFKDDSWEELFTGKVVFEVTDLATEREIKRQIQSITLPATYLGNIAYLNQLRDKDELILDKNEPFQKQTYRSRCTILAANGIQNLIVPVIRPNGKATKMSEALISYVENWQKDHQKAIESAYARAAFYDFYGPDLLEIIGKKHERLIDLNLALTQFMVEAFKLNCTVRLGSETEATDRMGKMLAHPKTTIATPFKSYHQLHAQDQFAPNLSAIDLLFNEGIMLVD